MNMNPAKHLATKPSDRTKHRRAADEIHTFTHRPPAQALRVKLGGAALLFGAAAGAGEGHSCACMRARLPATTWPQREKQQQQQAAAAATTRQSIPCPDHGPQKMITTSATVLQQSHSLSLPPLPTVHFPTSCPPYPALHTFHTSRTSPHLPTPHPPGPRAERS